MKNKYLLLIILVIILLTFLFVIFNENPRYGDFPHHGPSPSSYFS